jgi:hypothetical protein
VLPAACSAFSPHAVVYDGYVYLECSGYGPTDSWHGPPVPAGDNAQFSYKSNSPTLVTSSWTYLDGTSTNADDGLGNRADFTVDHMAVPFDGVGTLVLTSGSNSSLVSLNDVWILSATGNFQPGMALNRWIPFQASGAAYPYSAPWSPRTDPATTTDMEGLRLIVAGGFSALFGITTGTLLNDVWQLSWIDGQTEPLVRSLTTSAGWSPRILTSLFNVHDWLFLYGGQTSANPRFVDDVLSHAPSTRAPSTFPLSRLTSNPLSSLLSFVVGVDER